MRLSRANIPLASEDRTHSQAIYTSPHNNLAPHFLPGFINLQHFRHSRWRNPVRLSKMGDGDVGVCASSTTTAPCPLRPSPPPAIPGRDIIPNLVPVIRPPKQTDFLVF